MKVLSALFMIFLFTANVLKADTIEMHLVGPHCIKVCKGATLYDSGFVYADTTYGSDVTIVQEGNIATEGTKNKGVFKLRYKAVDKSGNIGYSEWRIIQVVDSSELPNCQPVAVDCDLLDTNLVSIKKNKLVHKINIYPNPANEELFLEADQFVNSIGIYSISGQKISEININQSLKLPYKINTKHFPVGIYMVQVKTASGIIHKKVQISR